MTRGTFFAIATAALCSLAFGSSTAAFEEKAPSDPGSQPEAVIDHQLEYGYFELEPEVEPGRYPDSSFRPLTYEFVGRPPLSPRLTNYLT